MSISQEDIAALRQEYSLRGLRRRELAAEPISQFTAWLAEALARGVIEPNAMTLATVDERGQPWSRTVLLKGCDVRGFTFFTNYESAKARQLLANPRVAITFCWAMLERQVNITGRVVRVSREESDTYFHSRPRASQLGAWASQQSEPVASREQLEQQMAAAGERYAGGEVPLPEHWGGYCVEPESVEFWQGSRGRLHDRLRYTRRAGAGWQVERLSP